MIVSATEFKTNVDKYLNLLTDEDIYITRNGKMVAKVVNTDVSAVDSISGLLSGGFPTDYDSKDLRKERLDCYEPHDGSV